MEDMQIKRRMRYQRATQKIPIVLRAEVVARIIKAAPGLGLRYRAAFNVAYGSGLRASEVTHLKVGDIDSNRMLIQIEQGKGRKDRHQGDPSPSWPCQAGNDDGLYEGASFTTAYWRGYPDFLKRIEAKRWTVLSRRS